MDIILTIIGIIVIVYLIKISNQLSRIDIITSVFGHKFKEEDPDLYNRCAAKKNQ